MYKYPKYQLEADRELMLFEFKSSGPKGIFIKSIRYSETSISNVFNLAFGDLDLESGEIDDEIRTNNGDRNLILATVASSIYSFTDKYPMANVFLTGSSDSRTRLYQIAISVNLDELSEDFLIYGKKDEDWESFQKGKNYEAFVLKRKK